LDLFAELKHQPIRIPELSRKLSLSRDYRVYRKLRQIIHEFQPDIVHTHTAKVGALGRYAAMKEGVPKIIHTYHGLIFENYFSEMLSKSLIKLDRYLASISDAIIVLSQNQQNALVDDFAICPKDKSYIVPLAIDVDEFQYNDETRKLFRHQYNLSSETIAIGILGRLVPIKNIKLFLDGIYYLKNHSKIDIRAFIIGDGVDVLFCNEEEATIYTGKNNLDDAITELRRIANKIIVTLGDKGAKIITGEKQVDIEVSKVKAIDTNGAGDMFAGAFMYGLTQGMSDRDAGMLASELAARTVATFGARLEKDVQLSILEKYLD